MCYIDPPCCLLSNTPKVSKGNKIREITTIRIRNIQIIKILSKSSIIHIHKRRKRPKKCGKLILFLYKFSPLHLILLTLWDATLVKTQRALFLLTQLQKRAWPGGDAAQEKLVLVEASILHSSSIFQLKKKSFCIFLIFLISFAMGKDGKKKGGK